MAQSVKVMAEAKRTGIHPDLLAYYQKYPHLISPATLALADGGWRSPRHWTLITKELLDFTGMEAARLMINVPFQHGKTKLCTNYFPAWILLCFPQTRIILNCYNEDFAMLQGAIVKDIVQKFGPELGINLKPDSRRKGEWVIDDFGGGMVCKGIGGGTQGRPADIFIIDDPVQTAEEALSPTVLQKHWDWYQTVVVGRSRKKTKVMIISTRWCRNDMCGHVLQRAKKIGEPWRVIKLKAIATEDDPLGRKPGEALWPEQVTLKQLEDIRKENRWFNACWQQEPVEEEGAHFKPVHWPRYLDIGDAYSIRDATGRRRIIPHDEVMVFFTVDWAMSEKKGSDYTAIGVFGLTVDGKLLILDFINKRLPIDQTVPQLAAVCQKWTPYTGTVEAQGFQAALAGECRRYKEIPEPRRLKRQGKFSDKLSRALPAIMFGENGRIYLPEVEQPWQEEVVNQLSMFTGIDDDHDDIVDCVADAAALANQLRNYSARREEPCLLIAGPERTPF